MISLSHGGGAAWTAEKVVKIETMTTAFNRIAIDEG